MESGFRRIDKILTSHENKIERNGTQLQQAHFIYISNLIFSGHAERNNSLELANKAEMIGHCCASL